jgi:hypothetical protein
MDERLKFIARLLDGEKMAGLCREFALDGLIGQQTKRPPGVARRWLRAGKRNQLSLSLAIDYGLDRRCLAFLATEHSVEAIVDKLRAHTRHHRNICIQRLAYLLVGPALPLIRLVALEQDTCLQSKLCRRLAFGDQFLQTLFSQTAAHVESAAFCVDRVLCFLRDR